MKAFKFVVTGVWLLILGAMPAGAQERDSVWSLNRCIQYALDQNISIRKDMLVSQTNQVSLKMATQSRYPSLNGSIAESFSMSRVMNPLNGSYSSYSGGNSTNYSLTASMTLFNGFKLNNNVKEAEKVLVAVGRAPQTVDVGIDKTATGSRVTVSALEQ